MQLIFEQIRTGGDRNFGYLLGDREAREGVLIDPSYAPELLVQRGREQGLTLRYIVNTHSHPDHTNGNGAAAGLTGALIAAHPGFPVTPDVVLDDGGVLSVGGLRLQVLHTPGHCDDHLVLYEAAAQILITGDLLFVGKVGGTRADADAQTEWRSLQRLVTAIPDPVTVWPGHDYGVRPSSTMKMEKDTNPFLQCADLAAFLQMKVDWPAVKKERGLK
jgi:glyoxylase-like metal-dependent hydrolase (beta-lactamase superfamily II)